MISGPIGCLGGAPLPFHGRGSTHRDTAIQRRSSTRERAPAGRTQPAHRSPCMRGAHSARRLGRVAAFATPPHQAAIAAHIPQAAGTLMAACTILPAHGASQRSHRPRANEGTRAHVPTRGFRRPAGGPDVPQSQPRSGGLLPHPTAGGLPQTLKQACSRRVSRSAMCVQRFDDSLSSAIHITYRISLRSSSLQ